MRRLPWNSCTTFAAIGSALAYALLIPTFGLHWQLIPGGIAGLFAAYVVSTSLGAWLRKIDIGRYPAHRIVAGIGAALTTLLAGAFAIASTNFLLQTAIDVTNSPSGQPFLNAVAESVPNHARELFLQPMLAAVLYGQWPALVLGVAYGALLAPANTPTPASARMCVASGSSVLLVLLVVGTYTSFFAGSKVRKHVPDGVPVAIAGCGNMAMEDGVLAYCPGSPCSQGLCQWDTKIDAFAVLVNPPQEGRWKWTGGGMGNTTSPHIVRHNMRWVQPGPDGYFDESNPQRHTSYELRFDGESLRVKRARFDFQPGMLLVIQYADDWSFTVRAGAEALLDTEVTIDQLQEKLDEICVRGILCDRSFRFTG